MSWREEQELSHDQIVKKLKKLISKGIIPQGKFDNQTTLMLTDSMYKQYQDTESAATSPFVPASKV